MKIAVTYANGQIFQHFGHTQELKVYNVEGNKIVDSAVVPTGQNGHGAMAGFLKSLDVDALICGGIGGGAKNALMQAGIAFFPYVQGSADDAVNAYLAGNLAFDMNKTCTSHENGHDCGHHNEEQHAHAGECAMRSSCSHHN